jgi:membrane associated rhomboid family serine protease
MLFLLVIAAIGAYIFFRVMTREERQAALAPVLAMLLEAKGAADRRRSAPEPFRDALRVRMRWPIVAPALVLLNLVIFFLMAFGPGALSDPQTLVSWGASIAPRTTNGEWWRLVSAAFVHAGPLQLFVNIVALTQIGILTERLTGSVAVLAVSLASAAFATLVSLTTTPLALTFGASGSICGLYGLLLGSLMWTIVRRSPVQMPLKTAKQLLPPAALFLLYNLMSNSLPTVAEGVAFVTGAAAGIALTPDIVERTPPLRRIAGATAVALAAIVAWALPMRGVANVGPEIDRVIAVEHNTADVYDAAVAKFRRGWVTAPALAQLIDHTIAPELQKVRVRLEALQHVPHEQQPLVATADEFLKLRAESWRLRADALRKANMKALREADKREEASLEAFNRIKAAGS